MLNQLMRLVMPGPKSGIKVNGRLLMPRCTGLKGSSFTICLPAYDTDEPATRTFIEGFTKTRTDTDELEAITAYVSEYINEPTYIHGSRLPHLAF